MSLSAENNRQFMSLFHLGTDDLLGETTKCYFQILTAN